MSGHFITFEGIDGSGKSTQAALLVQALQSRGVPVLHTREPGGTELGASLRALLLERRDLSIDVRAEALMMAADRAQHVAQVIKPALRRGEIVVSERYVDSSLAYQGAAGLEAQAIRAVNAVATCGLVPSLTLLLDIEPEHAFRAEKADRIEARATEYHHAVRRQFLQLQRAEPERIRCLDVTGRTPAQVHAMVRQVVDQVLALERAK